MLKKLILSINECNLNKSLIKNVYIIIVDNDIDKTAESVINELKESFNDLYKFYYFNHPDKGISNVRNELIKKARLLNPDFIVFIDDDEYVTSEWLNELVKTIINNNADAVRGPVLAIIDETIPKNISFWFKRESYTDNSQIYSLTTGNLILKCTTLQKYNVWFDPRFNSSGSEDGYFGIQIFKMGAKIYWSERAIAYENIPKSRANLFWLVKRIFRTSSTYSYMLRLENEYFLIIKKVVVSIIYVTSGFLASIALLTNLKKKYWGILKMAEGLGGLIGVMNITYKEYKKNGGD